MKVWKWSTGETSYKIARPEKKEPLEKLCRDGQLNAFTHNGFWHPMDTLRDKIYLENLWSCKKAPWKLWND
jgi:glucose-1-phosphate cytidylyltransferase